MSNLGNLVSGGLPWWLAALLPIAAAVVAYELITATTGRTALRLPLLILKCARFGMSREDWEYEGPEYEAEALFYLADRRRGRVGRFIRAICFTVPLALGAARAASRVWGRPSVKARKRRGVYVRGHWRMREPTTLQAAAMPAVTLPTMLSKLLMDLGAPSWVSLTLMGMSAFAAVIMLFLVLELHPQGQKSRDGR
ncbi:hypothetical protein [Streptomyces sp. NPDC058891]|uniref:hypothetical protein n=1 Tax=Streptomyces sp. NPDC058891 TaxID=3346667 RepID=UPI0036932DC3